jgi:hypothetical protein
MNPGTFDPTTGACVLQDVAVGTYALTVNADGYAERRIEGVVVAANDTTAVGSIELDRGVEVVLRLRWPDGVDLRPYEVQLRGASDPGTRSPRTLAAASDGTYAASGFEPGSWRLVAIAPLRHGGGQPPPLLEAMDAPIQIAATEGSVRHDATLVVGGTLVLGSADPRLPALGEPASDAERRFGEGARIRLTGPDGRVLYEHTGLARGWAGPGAWQHLLPGRYAVRLELPDTPPREETIELEAGAHRDVRFGP